MPTLGITNFWTYVLGAVFVILLPRPNSLFILMTSAQRGMATGYRTACGTSLGDAVLMLLSVLGMVSLLKAKPMLFIGLKYPGAAYPFHLSVDMLRDAWRKLRNPGATTAQAGQVDIHQLLHKALLPSLSNPKAILFFTFFFIQLVDPGCAYSGLLFLMLAAILELVSALHLGSPIFTGVRLAAWSRRRQRLIAGTTSGIDTLFVGFDVELTTAAPF